MTARGVLTQFSCDASCGAARSSDVDCMSLSGPVQALAEMTMVGGAGLPDKTRDAEAHRKLNSKGRANTMNEAIESGYRAGREVSVASQRRAA
jgi:hypothetical protein